MLDVDLPLDLHVGCLGLIGTCLAIAAAIPAYWPLVVCRRAKIGRRWRTVTTDQVCFPNTSRNRIKSDADLVVGHNESGKRARGQSALTTLIEGVVDRRMGS